MNRNAYQDLGLPNFASQKEIKKAFRSLALKHHPDRGGDEEKMKVINQAYEFLQKHKEQYDRQLKNSNFGQPTTVRTYTWSAETTSATGQGSWSFHFTF